MYDFLYSFILLFLTNTFINCFDFLSALNSLRRLLCTEIKCYQLLGIHVCAFAFMLFFYHFCCARFGIAVWCFFIAWMLLIGERNRRREAILYMVFFFFYTLTALHHHRYLELVGWLSAGIGFILNLYTCAFSCVRISLKNVRARTKQREGVYVCLCMCVCTEFCSLVAFAVCLLLYLDYLCCPWKYFPFLFAPPLCPVPWRLRSLHSRVTYISFCWVGFWINYSTHSISFANVRSENIFVFDLTGAVLTAYSYCTPAALC